MRAVKLTKKDWLGLFAMTGAEKRFLALLLALAVLGLVGRYFYLHGRQPESHAPDGLPEHLLKSQRAPVAD